MWKISFAVAHPLNKTVMYVCVCVCVCVCFFENDFFGKKYAITVFMVWFLDLLDRIRFSGLFFPLDPNWFLCLFFSFPGRCSLISNERVND